MKNVLILFLLSSSLFGAGVTTERNDIARSSVYTDTGTNAINRTNVSMLKKKATFAASGDIYAQPLIYEKPLPCTVTPCRILILASVDNHVTGWDADATGTPTKLWDYFTGTPESSECNGDFVGNICGLTATPVIDQALGVVWVESQIETTHVHHLTSLDIATGAQYHADVLLNATDPFSGITFASSQPFEIARAGLVLIAGHIYITYASRTDAFTGGFGIGYTWFGWILRVSESSFTVDAATCNTCAASLAGGTGGGGGMWMGGVAPTSDGTYLYVVGGNGTFVSANGEYGTSVAKYDLALNFIDWWTPYNYAALTAGDLDLTSPPVLMPPKWLIFSGKDAIVRVADRTNMGHLEPTTSPPAFTGTNLQQEFDLAIGALTVGHILQGIMISPTNNDLYVSGGGGPILRFAWNAGTNLIQDTATATAVSGSNTAGQGAMMLFCWDGVNATSGVLLAVSGGYTPATGPIIAYDPLTLRQLWTSGNVAGDALGNVPKMSSPIVANGTLYVPTRSSQLVSYARDSLTGMVQ